MRNIKIALLAIADSGMNAGISEVQCLLNSILDVL